MSTAPALPSVFAYLDYRAFLADWFAAKRASNPRYSHRLFASRAGFASPSLLHLVIKGERNITAHTLGGFARALGLSADQRGHLELLVAFDRASRIEERNALYRRIRSRRHFRGATALESAGFDYLSDWTVPAIRELIGCAGARWDARWIARRLRPSISRARAQRAMDLLEALGLVEVSGDTAVQREASVVTPHEVTGLAIFNYHRSMIGQAVEALDTASAPLRHYGAVTVRVDDPLLQELKTRIADFQEEILALCDAHEGGDRVVQLNLQLFPLSGKVS